MVTFSVFDLIFYERSIICENETNRAISNVKKLPLILEVKDLKYLNKMPKYLNSF